MKDTSSGGKRPGPKADHLRIEGDPTDAIRRIFEVQKPEGGWPKPDRRSETPPNKKDDK